VTVGRQPPRSGRRKAGKSRVSWEAHARFWERLTDGGNLAAAGRVLKIDFTSPGIRCQET
jgi:hypothetical protein